MRRKKIFIFSIILIILIFGYLSIQGLDNNYFWDDEAATAIFARNFIKFGELTGWDGRNLFSFRGGLILDQNFINKFDSPLQFIVTALSFEIIGESTFSARIPFVLFGIFSLVLFCRIISLEFNNQGDLKLFALLLFAFSPSFLLFIRQCHYYSLVLFFSLFIYYQYKKYLSTKNLLYLGLSVVGFIGLFLSHYLISLAFGVAIIGIHLKYYLKQRPIYPYLIAGAVIISFIAIYINVYQVIIPKSHPEFNIEWLTNKGIFIRWVF
jgi:predicted membrane-bound mannosyltransferase